MNDNDVEDPRWLRVCEIYRGMAVQARYRPAAPSDGLGGIELTPAQLCDPERLQQEAEDYAREFVKADERQSFDIGCSNFSTLAAFVCALEALRRLASADNAGAAQLLGIALRSLPNQDADLDAPEARKRRVAARAARRQKSKGTTT